MKNNCIVIGTILFLVTALGAPGFSQIPQSQRDALIAFYQSTNGDSWSGWVNWKEAPLEDDGFSAIGSECSWTGVVCHGHSNTVTRLILESRNLSGPIPPEIAGLTDLVILDLTTNKLNGILPSQLGQLSALVYLDLEDNQLTGPIPPQLGDLSNLIELDFEDNLLTGNIPYQLGNLSQLEQLDLDTNNIDGTIPVELGQLSNLVDLDLEINSLEGTIPWQLGQLSNLEILDLEGNNLVGSIPEQLGMLSQLLELDLANNDLTGPIPSSLGNLSSLEALYLENNSLWGCVPPSLGDLTNLNVIWLNDNALSGDIPEQLTALTNLVDNDSNFINNNLNTTVSTDLENFLSAKQIGGDWHSSQTSITDYPRIEPSKGCGGYTPCHQSFQEAFAAETPPATIFVAEGDYAENLEIDSEFILVLTWPPDFGCSGASQAVVLMGP